MGDRLRRPTMNDVAQASGVSLKSVSRVINDEVGASPATRERVLAAARKLGYRRNDAACVSMLAYVQSAGCVLFLIAAFSAGSPNASQPMGCSTLWWRWK